MAQVFAIGDAVNDEERKAIAWLKDKLPDDYFVIHSFEVEQFDQLFEVDICVVTPHAIYLVDVKGIHGQVEVEGTNWRTSHSSYRSPLPKLRGNAKSLSGLICKQNRANKALKNIYIDTAVLLTIDECKFIDPENRERGHVVLLKNSTRFFTDSQRIPDRFDRNVTKYIQIILTALGKAAKKRSHGERFGNWEVAETLTVNECFTEYRTFNITAGLKGGTVLAKAYNADPYLPEDERLKQKRLLENAYRAIAKMPPHSAIVGVKDFFVTEAQDKYILLTDDIPGDNLSAKLKDTSAMLTLDQKKRIVKDMLLALSHMCHHGVVHRNITPDHILIGLDGQPRLIDFDYARIGAENSTTIADEVQERISNRYKAPELWADNRSASCASDIYSLGLVIYELFSGNVAFDTVTEAIEKSCEFNTKLSQQKKDLPTGFDDWLQALCHKDASNRLTAEQALTNFKELWQPKTKIEADNKPAILPTLIRSEATSKSATAVNYKRLKSGYQLSNKYIVQQPLGKPGGFGVVYKVTDTFGDVSRAIKLILHDRESVLERLKQEYRTLLKLPEHPYVVKVYDADVLPNDGPPYIVFEYLEGLDVSELIQQRSLTAHEVWTMAKQVAEGLQHLHDHSIYHCDIKPQNLIWKDGKVRIIDFNVSVDAEDLSQGGGSRKYLPPDLNITETPQASDLVDRDLYALGITLYRAMTGEYPWAKTECPPPFEEARHPSEFTQSFNLTDDVSSILLKLIAPKRTDRFETAEQFLEALNKIQQLKKAQAPSEESTSQFHLPPLSDGSNPSKSAFHDYLLTLYSQSRHSNSGTRGLDDYAKLIYVDTSLDTELAPAVLAGQLRLVLITGNAGDGKTAFLQQLESLVEEQGVTVALNPQGNGSAFEINGHQYVTNYDGSQDEGDRDNELVLDEFFNAYQGNNFESWPHNQTRLIAINEGRLVDFLSKNADDFLALKSLVEESLKDGSVQNEVAVVNLNMRDVLAATDAQPKSIFERIIGKMTAAKVWQGCDYCALKDKCYVKHNVATFQDEQTGPKVIKRLSYLYKLTSLRNQLHITMRDLRSALSYMLVGEYSCAEIKEIYANGDSDKILNGYYFNAWCGAEGTQDRLLKLLRETDIAQGCNVRLDRGLDYLGLDAVDWLQFEQRSEHEIHLLENAHQALPSGTALSESKERYLSHRNVVGMLKRKAYFELRGENWRSLLPYRSAKLLVSFLEGEKSLEEAKTLAINAINRGEGLHNPMYFNGQLAMQVRKVNQGTIKSYRLFPSDVFSIEVKDSAMNSVYIEHSPHSLLLKYQDETGLHAELELDLDLFEMLQRLNHGYVPSAQAEQSFYLSLTVFKNVLASAPYQEVLLTTNGHHYEKIIRNDDGVLQLEHIATEASL
ncbi:methylation-associated defense system protein kinase MAD6 [Brumicola nitratireducens]|uniref:non-specific serine/threonine protein kinase n=1 Tax=Glaciecola nitratireducens (strain JCM 12485 / KCTC 12276 / FR1064) TaxID=1085623 RepID=G4QL08_GLANF|nr:protein kinase [Glaciecola nitratireducens]AEP29398.1 protein kinase putative [Glaciecola nitratireducens FR1064]